MDKPLGGHPKFYELRKRNEKLYSDKHYQYATDADPMSNFRLCGNLIHKLLKPGVDPTIAAALTLMSKQIVGVYEIVGEGKVNTIESLEDKLRDIEIYATILQVLVDEKKQGDEVELKQYTDFPTTKDLMVKDGPYCCRCEHLAEFRYDFKLLKHDPAYFCSNCRAECDIPLSECTVMGTL